jgi:hypothetical protein
MPQPDAHSTIAALNNAAKENYLGDPAIIDGLLQLYGKEIVDRLDEVAAGRITNRAAGMEDTKGATRLARIFTGKEAGYQPMGTWNTGGELSRFLRREFGITEKDNTDTVEVFMVNFALCIRYAYKLMQEDPISDWQGSIDDSLQIFSGCLLGVPRPKDD